MNPVFPLSLAFLLTLATGSAEPADTERRLREQERQIEQLELENSRLRWLLQHRNREAVIDPLYGVSGAEDSKHAMLNRSVHVVQKGESLSGIALSTGTDLEELAALNQLRNPGLIRIGQVLELPQSRENPRRQPTPSSRPRFHIVKAGENLYRIALRHGLSLETLLSSNPEIDPHALQVGQKVKVGTDSAQAGEPANDGPGPVS